MTDEGVPGATPPPEPTTRQVGWYRDRQTGRRSYWNGVEWIDLAAAVTPLTFKPEPLAPAAPPPPPTVAAKKVFDRQAKLIAASVAVAVVILGIVLGLVLSNTGNAPVSTKGTVPSPASAPGRSALRPSPPTTTSLLGSTTTTSTTTTTTTTVVGAPGGTGPALTTPTVTSPEVPNAEGNVALVGDSITVLTETDLERVFRHDDLTIDAKNGSTMVDHLPRIEQLVSDGLPRDWVIELGTNDAFQANPNWASDFANQVTTLQSQPCVVFLTVNPRMGPIATGINGAITAAVASHPNFHAVDWGDIEFRNARWLLGDGIHPTKAGALELAKLDHQAIRGCQGQ